MYIVLDLEFYHNSKKDELGPIKQLGAFKFDENYRIIDIFEMTVTKYSTQAMLKQLFNEFVSDVTTIYVWAKNNDIRAMKGILDLEHTSLQVIDVQEYFKEVNLASLSTISEALSFDPEGRHNALIDAEYTFEIVKHFNLNNEFSRQAIASYVNLIRSNEVNQKRTAKEFIKKTNKKPVNTKIISPGSMRKLNDDYYQIVNERAITQLVADIATNRLAIIKDGNFKLNSQLEILVDEGADIVFSNTKKFKDVSKKYEDKLIIIVDENNETYLAVFISKKIYKQFIK